MSAAHIAGNGGIPAEALARKDWFMKRGHRVTVNRDSDGIAPVAIVVVGVVNTGTDAPADFKLSIAFIGDIATEVDVKRIFSTPLGKESFLTKDLILNLAGDGLKRFCAGQLNGGA